MRGALVLNQKTEYPFLPAGYKLLFEERFLSTNALGGFILTDPKAWRIVPASTNGALELITQSNYRPAVRSPVNIALLADKVFGDFILEADFLQTGREYGHRDMCIFFGFQGPARFYYTHIATAADPNAHNIFVVNDKPRTNIARETTKGANWGLEVWHRVRLERKVDTGAIRVFFDDLQKPIMIAEDKTFGAGYLGFGSFDDTGKIANIRIWGPAVENRKATFSF